MQVPIKIHLRYVLRLLKKLAIYPGIMTVILTTSGLKAETLTLVSGEVLIGEITGEDASFTYFHSTALGDLKIPKTQLTSNLAATLTPLESNSADQSPENSPFEASVDQRPLLNRLTHLPGKLSGNYRLGLQGLRNQNKAHSLSAMLELKWELEHREISTFHSILSAKYNAFTIEDQRNHSFRYIEKISDKWRWLNQYDWFFNSESLIDEQWHLVSVPSRYLINTEKTTLLLGVGGGYTSLRFSDEAIFYGKNDPGFESSRSGMALVGFQLFRTQLLPALELKEVFLGYAKIDGEWSGADIVISLEHAITRSMGISLDFRSTYSSNPAPTVPHFTEKLELMFSHRL